MGSHNSKKLKDTEGIVVSIKFNDLYKVEYEDYIKNEVTSIPIEFYEMERKSFADFGIASSSIPVKSYIIDSTNYVPLSGSDVYISRIINNVLSLEERNKISQASRNMKVLFSEDSSVVDVNKSINNKNEDDLSIDIDFGTKKTWERMFITKSQGIPYNNLGKGSQCMLKTSMIFNKKNVDDKGIVLIEEPESHLSHSNLNVVLNKIENQYNDKQLIISTHSSFVANKLGLDKLILLNNNKTIRLNDLKRKTYDYFRKLNGFDTLRILLAEKVILVEGGSDELIVQRAYLDEHNKLPIEKGVDIISVGLSFKRFLEIAVKLNSKTCVITDNDGNIAALKEKYKDYIGKKDIEIYYDSVVHPYSGTISNYNNNTLEPCLLRSNNLNTLNDVLGKKYKNEDELLLYMKENKTDVALKIFNSDKKINYPEYILKAVKK